MRKIARSLTCPSEYSIGVNTNLHSPLPLSLSFSFFTSKEKRGDRKQRLRATLGDTFIRTGTGKGYFVCISCRPSSASYKSTKGESVSTYASIPIPRRRRGNLEMPWIFVSNCAISARFHPKGVSGGGQMKIHTQAKYRRLAYWVRFFFVGVIMWERMCGGGRKNGRGEQRNSRSNSRMEE